MLPFLQLILALVIIITIAKAGGYLSYKLGQPTVSGEVLAGLILGPTLLNMLNWPFFTDTHLAENIAHLAELGVLILMFIAGLELHLEDLIKSSKIAVLAGVLGFLVPVAMGYGAGTLFNFDLQQALFIGLALAPTSVSISAQTLMELKVLRTPVGISLLGAAVVDDILVVLGISIFAVLVGGSGGGLGSVLLILLRMILYLAIAIVLGVWVIPRLAQWVDRLPISQGLIAFTLVVLLLYGWSAEVLGKMAVIIGSFLAGVFLGQSEVKEKIERGLVPLAYGFLVPVFFVNVGLSSDLRQISAGGVWFLAALTLVAILSKVIGSGGGALLGRMTARQSLRLGASMISRGEVGLIAVSIGIAEGWIGGEVVSAVVIMVIITTLITPILLRWLYASKSKPNESPADQTA
jgi:Kef-type K+ transport system membrane component KefB